MATAPDRDVPGTSMGAAATKAAEGNRSVSRPTVRIRLSRRDSSLSSCVRSALKLVPEAITVSPWRLRVTEPVTALVLPTASVLAGRRASRSRTRYPTTDSGLGFHVPSTSPLSGTGEADAPPSPVVDTLSRSGEEGVKNRR